MWHIKAQSRQHSAIWWTKKVIIARANSVPLFGYWLLSPITRFFFLKSLTYYGRLKANILCGNIKTNQVWFILSKWNCSFFCNLIFIRDRVRFLLLKDTISEKMSHRWIWMWPRLTGNNLTCSERNELLLRDMKGTLPKLLAVSSIKINALFRKAYDFWLMEHIFVVISVSQKIKSYQEKQTMKRWKFIFLSN